MNILNAMLHVALSLASLLSVALSAKLNITYCMLVAGVLAICPCMIALRSPPQGAVWARAATAVVLMTVMMNALTSIWHTIQTPASVSLPSHLMTVLLATGLCWNLVFLRTDRLPPRSEFLSLSAATATFGGPSLILAFCCACVLTTLVLLFGAVAPLRWPFFTEASIKLLQRGSIPPTTLFIFCWGMLLLVAKTRAISVERRVLVQLGWGGLRPRSALLSELARVLTDQPEPQLPQESTELRVERYFGFLWQIREDSYIFPRYSIWAVPILGFLGTVVGISDAVAAIGAVMSAPQGNIASRIGDAVAPLAVAFDTTLISLTLSLVLVFIQSLVQRWEVDLLTRLELLARPAALPTTQHGGRT